MGPHWAKPLPTNQPTPLPSIQPTPLPTDQPTSLPTSQPTPMPTPLPTFAPTFVPTQMPTSVPTPSPTLNDELATTILGYVAGIIWLGVTVLVCKWCAGGFSGHCRKPNKGKVVHTKGAMRQVVVSEGEPEIYGPWIAYEVTKQQWLELKAIKQQEYASGDLI